VIRDATVENHRIMYTVVTTKSFNKSIAKPPANWQKRIVAKIKEIAQNPYAPNNNLTRLQGRVAYRLRVADWRVIYELHDDRLVMLVLEVGSRGGIY
jgi:mRNA interferase RelE/StbE